MKRSIKGILLFIMVVAITGCGTLKTYEPMSYNLFEKKLEAKESFVLVIGSAVCTHCSDYKKVVEEVLNEYDIVIYYIEIQDLTDEQNAVLDAKTHYNYATPVTVFFEQGQLVATNTIRGTTTKAKLERKLTTLGYIE